MQRITDLHALPKIRDGLSYLYVDRCRIEREANGVALFDKDGKTSIPCAALATLLLGPGTTITHAAILTLADCGCQVIWCGEEGVRFYAEGGGRTRRAERLLHQARVWADAEAHGQVVRRLYAMRFPEDVPEGTTLAELRGREGARVRSAYREASEEHGVPWRGRTYRRGRWAGADPVNRALSAANACLYGVSHAAILAAGYSPALGFIHTGKMNSFVYDVADLYKLEVCVPAAFQTVAQGTRGVEGRVRGLLRDRVRDLRLLARIVPDLDAALGRREVVADASSDHADEDADGAVPSRIWDPGGRELPGGTNFADEGEGEA